MQTEISPNIGKIAVIVGSQGQDGYYLSKLLFEKGYQTFGIAKNSCLQNLTIPKNSIDITSKEEVSIFLKTIQPSEIYYLAAYHHSAEKREFDFCSEYELNYDIHVKGLLNFLEAIRQSCPKSRLFYAASSHIFGDPALFPQNEQTPFQPICPYGITKAIGVELCHFYRKNYEIFSSVGILYNHESPRRNPKFVTRRIIQTALQIKKGITNSLVLGNCKAKTDWGAAEDYVEAMHKIILHDISDDFIIASGESHSVQEFVDIVFDILNLNRDSYLIEDNSLLHKIERQHLVGDASKLKLVTKWKPFYTFKSLVEYMVMSEITILNQNGVA